MNDIALLERRLSEAHAALAHSEATAAEHADNPLYAISTGSFRRHVEDLQHQLYLARAVRDREVVELRLHGAHLNTGAVPLTLLARLAEHFVHLFGGLAHRAQHGKDALRLSDDLLHRLDLRLAGVEYGSTRLILTGNTLPDLAGDSLLESSLQQVFGLLTDNEGIADKVADAGVRSVRHLDGALKTLERENTAADLRWLDARDIEHVWRATPQDITAVRARLASYTEIPPEDIELTAFVQMLNVNGRVHLLTADSERMNCRFPRDIYGQVQTLTLGAPGRFRVRIEKTLNQITGQVTRRCTLLEILSVSDAHSV